MKTLPLPYENHTHNHRQCFGIRFCFILFYLYIAYSLHCMYCDHIHWSPVVFYPYIFMMTSSNGNISRFTDAFCGEFTGPGEFPTQRPVTRSFDVFFHLRPNKRLCKQPWGWWFEMPSRSLWRHTNVIMQPCINQQKETQSVLFSPVPVDKIYIAILWDGETFTIYNVCHLAGLILLCILQFAPSVSIQVIFTNA